MARGYRLAGMNCQWLLPFVLGLALAPAGWAQPPQQRRHPYFEFKFGMFIHWGPYSLASVEASWPIMRPARWRQFITEPEYWELCKRFNPTRFDPYEWVRLAREAGQRYMVFTTKHHDGFCMFDSAYTDYKITNTPYGKDLLAELAEACRKQGMPLGFYYSPPDMHHPGFRDTSKPAEVNWQGEPTRPDWFLYLDYMEAQIRELLTGYGPVLVMWFDGLGEQRKYDPWRFHRLIRELSPDTLINNRLYLPGDFETPEQFLPAGVPLRGQRIAGTDPGPSKGLDPGYVPSLEEFRPWETCMTINRTWAYNERDREFKSTEQLIRTLVEVASRGGSFLLNVGPAADGTIQPEFQQRLRGIGQWLRRNGEAIYGTTYGPWQGVAGIRSTAKPGAVYLHLLEWPAGGAMEIDWPLKNLRRLRCGEEPVRVVALASGGELPFRWVAPGSRLRIELPAQPPDQPVAVLRIELR